MRKEVGFGLTHIFIREHKKWRSLKTCFFKAQGVPELSIFLWVFQHPFVPGVDIEKLVWVSGFCPFFPGGLPSSIVINLRRYKAVHF
jgi:hypothetical protein